MVFSNILNQFCKQINNFKLLHINLKITDYTSKMPFYAVAKGHKPGIYNTWDECQKAVLNAKHAKFKKFSTKEQAQEFINMFKGHVYEPTSCEKLSAPIAENPSCIELSSDDELFYSEEFINHLEKIDQITEQYKESLQNEISSFRKNMLIPCTQISNRNFSTFSCSKENLKRKNNSNDYEHEQKVLKLKNNIVKDKEYDFLIDKDGFVHVYTDGACEQNGKSNAKAGLGVWFGPNHPLNVGEPIKGRPTNNVGEIQACTKAIQIAHRAGAQKLCINTDSQFVINSMTTWIKGWKKNNWMLKSGTPVKNKLDFIELDRVANLLEIKWNYVKGHAGIAGNEGADTLAKKGAQEYKK